MTDQPRPPYYNPDHRRARAAEQQAAQQAADEAKRAKQATLPRGNVVPVSEWVIAWALDRSELLERLRRKHRGSGDYDG